MKRTPIIDVTDLYHPHQDPGDNIDILWALGLPDVDLRAVILDATQEYRSPFHHPNDEQYSDPHGQREPGIIPMAQLSYLFDREVPHAMGCFERMSDPNDPLDRVSRFQQTGIERILHELERSKDQVHILSFGSCRTIAAAYNRNPDLMKRKVARVYVSAGSSGDYLEWNVNLDPAAYICLMSSELPIAWYPCATSEGPFAKDHHNTYWLMPDLHWLYGMDPKLQRYLVYVLDKECRNDFLQAMDEPADPARLAAIAARHHHVWETAIWFQALGRSTTSSASRSIEELLEPIWWSVDEQARIKIEPADGRTGRWRYYRNDPDAYEQLMQTQVPQIYQDIAKAASFQASSLIN